MHITAIDDLYELQIASRFSQEAARLLSKDEFVRLFEFLKAPKSRLEKYRGTIASSSHGEARELLFNPNHYQIKPDSQRWKLLHSHEGGLPEGIRPESEASRLSTAAQSVRQPCQI